MAPKKTDMKTASAASAKKLDDSDVELIGFRSGSADTLPTNLLVAYLLLIGVTVTSCFTVVPIYTHMILDVMLVIYIGSVKGASELTDPDEKKNKTELEKQKEARMGATQERLSNSDIKMFPIMGSITLFSLYMCFKYIPKEYINVVIKLWFLLAGVLILAAQASELFRALSPLKWRKRWDHVWLFIHAGDVWPMNDDAAAAPLEQAMDLTSWDAFGLIFSVAISAWYLITEHWSASNLFGIAFSIQGIESMMLGSYVNGVVLLCGLFFYDIFWVFGTDVMVTVATKFDAPIKLLFPYGEYHPSMLGLGDIVIPGLFIALMLRFDIWLNTQAQQNAKKNNTTTEAAPKASYKYFWWVMLFYFLGLTTTVLVMYEFKSAQPALLYLVPACILGSAGPALVYGDFQKLWQYEDEQTEDDDDDKAKKE